MSRPSFHSIFMETAVKLAERSTCTRGFQVGTLITSADFRAVYSLGYNGNASGLPNACDRTGAEAVGNCGCLHAEDNTVINCTAPRDAKKVVFVTMLPCVACAKRFVNLGGVTHVYYLNDYRIRDSLKVFDAADIPIERYWPTTQQNKELFSRPNESVSACCGCGWRQHALCVPGVPVSGCVKCGYGFFEEVLS